MKRSILFLLPVLLVASMAYADCVGDASANVYVKVDPNVAVSCDDPYVDAGTVQMGDFFALVKFRVDANLQYVYLYAEATELWKGDDPNGTEVAPIPLNLSNGVTIEPTNANAMGEEDNVADFLSAAPDTSIDAYPAFKTEMVCFESSQNNHFSQDVTLTVWWTQDDPEKPTGEYSGKVRLTCVLIPEAPSCPEQP